MSDAIHARGRPGEIELAVLRDGGLEDYALWHPGRPDGLGDLLLGRVRARDPVTGGAFVALPDRPDGFLPDREAETPPREGERVPVRVIRAARGGKGARLSARLDAAARALVLARGSVPGPTPLDELRARHPGLPLRADTAAIAARLGPAAGRGAFPKAAAEAIDALGEPAVVLPGGAVARIHPTPALVAIDVDLGGAGDRRAPRGAAQVAANLALIPALARQIRLRELGGAILIDFGGLAARKRAALAPALADALARDPLAPRLLGFTALGLAEIVRAARRAPLHERRAHPHAALLDAAAAWRDAALRPGPAPELVLSPELAALRDADRVLEAELAAETGQAVRIDSDPSVGPPGWRLRR